jgi:hypothetical protein
MRVTQTSDGVWCGHYVRFVRVAKSSSGLTVIYTVCSMLNDAKLGTVRWFARWRCYAFMSEPFTVFESTCLMDIATFCRQRTQEHRHANRRAS